MAPENSSPLTARQAEVLSLLATGLENKEIAAILHLSYGAVKGNLNRAYHNLRAINAIHAVAIAVKRELI